MGRKTIWVLVAKNLLLSILKGPLSPPPSFTAAQIAQLLGCWPRQAAEWPWGDIQPLCWYLGSPRWWANICCWETDLFQIAVVNLLHKSLGESDGRSKHKKKKKKSAMDPDYHKVWLLQEFLSKKEDRRALPIHYVYVPSHMQVELGLLCRCIPAFSG